MTTFSFESEESMDSFAKKAEFMPPGNLNLFSDSDSDQSSDDDCSEESSLNSDDDNHDQIAFSSSTFLRYNQDIFVIHSFSCSKSWVSKRFTNLHEKITFPFINLLYITHAKKSLTFLKGGFVQKNYHSLPTNESSYLFITPFGQFLVF